MSRTVDIVPLSGIEPKPVRWLWEGRIPAAELTLLAGPEGVGKSTFLAYLAAQATHGRLAGDLYGKPCGVVIAALEDDEASTLRPRIEAAGANLDLVASIHIRVGRDDAALVLPDDLDALAARMLAPNALPLPVGLLIIDPIKSAATSINPDRDTEVRSLLAPLVRIAQARRVTIVPSGHFKKGSTTEDRATWKVSGSPAWTQVPRSTLFFAEDPENDEDDNARLIAHAKCNVGRRQPSLTAQVQTAHIRTSAGETIETSRLIIGAESNVKADEIGQRADKHGAGADARAFLVAYLDDGEQAERRKVIADAAKEGISESAIKRAAKDLKVAISRRGSGAEHRSYWALPHAGEGSSDLCELSEPSADTQPTQATQINPDDELTRLTRKGVNPVASPSPHLSLVEPGTSAPGGTFR